MNVKVLDYNIFIVVSYGSSGNALWIGNAVICLIKSSCREWLTVMVIMSQIVDVQSASKGEICQQISIFTCFWWDKINFESCKWKIVEKWKFLAKLKKTVAIMTVL